MCRSSLHAPKTKGLSGVGANARMRFFTYVAAQVATWSGCSRIINLILTGGPRKVRVLFHSDLLARATAVGAHARPHLVVVEGGTLNRSALL